MEIEIICSDTSEHRSRVESRSTDIDGLQLPTWQEVVDRHYQVWPSEHIVLDTAGRDPEISVNELIRVIELAMQVQNEN